MKTLVPLIVLSTWPWISAIAQDAPTGKSSLQVQTDKKGAEKIAAPNVKVPGKSTEPRVLYGGVLVDLARGNKPAKPVDLRDPPKAKPVRDNVYTDPQTGAVKGFVLFAIKF